MAKEHISEGSRAVLMIRSEYKSGCESLKCRGGNSLNEGREQMSMK